MSLSRCQEYYKIYIDLEERILRALRAKGALSFDSLREELERGGVYMDSRCLRKKVADMIRSGRISKKPDQALRKLLLTPSQNDGQSW